MPPGPRPLAISLALVALGCAACLGRGSDPIDRDPPPPSTSRPPSPPGSSSSPSGPPTAPGTLEIRSVTLPASPSDLVPLTIVLGSARALPVRLQIDLSTDGGLTYRSARLRGAIGDLPAQPQGTEHVVEWSSLEDLGFRVPRAARLRIVASDREGPSRPVEIDTPTIDNLKAAARRVQSYLIHYGPFDPKAVALAKQHDLVIVHPTAASLERPLIAELQGGIDPQDPADDVIVMCYVSVGVDERPYGQSDAEARMDPRFRGDGTGPRIDPRGKDPQAGTPLSGLAAAGLPSGGGGWASYYLDDNSVFRSPTGVGDGIPDRNGEMGGFFVNAGDPKWFELLDGRLLDGPDRVAGLREILTTGPGRGLGCDGLFLDTLDTAAPNFFTGGASSPNLSKFEWTAAGMSRFVARVRGNYPDRLLLQNRGLFYLDPRLPHFQVTTRGQIDLLLFESYRLSSYPAPDDFHRDNRFNVAPKLMAEANRADGFTVLSLGFAEGTGLPGSVDTLAGRSMVGIDSLLEDINVAQNLTGFRHYMTNARVSLVNSFVRDNSNFDDGAPPRWTSVYNARAHDPVLGPREPTPRVGIQQVVPVAGGLTVRWDVALDLHRVGYALYYQSTPFDFAADPKLTRATRRVLQPGIPAAYARGVGPEVYPFEDTIRPLDATNTYYLVIRAFDESGARNEDGNTVVLSATPGAP